MTDDQRARLLRAARIGLRLRNASRLSASVVLAISVLNGCERFETLHSNYTDYATAVKADAVGFAKWLPELLPQSARDIRETHNLDSNETWVTFRYSQEDLPTIVQHCPKVGEEKVRRARKPLNNWWPAALVQDTGPSPLAILPSSPSSSWCLCLLLPPWFPL
jgi:hypothetical protein